MEERLRVVCGWKITESCVREEDYIVRVWKGDWRQALGRVGCGREIVRFEESCVWKGDWMYVLRRVVCGREIVGTVWGKRSEEEVWVDEGFDWLKGRPRRFPTSSPSPREKTWE